MFMFESQLVQMPGPRDIILYWPGPRAFFVVQKPRGWAHISVQKPRSARGGMVTGQIDTCISLTSDSYANAHAVSLSFERQSDQTGFLPGIFSGDLLLCKFLLFSDQI